ncbi:MAG: pyridoxal-dependent decarboxylase [Actinomycetota bacterium]
MTPEELRQRGRETVDWVASYLERVEDFPVLSSVAPGEIRSKLPASPPEHSEAFEDVLRDLEEIVLPGITHWQSPNFFGFFPANSSGPSVLGELLSAGLGVQGMMWATSPACTELEAHVLDWLVQMLALPDRFLSTGAGGGVIQDSASSATLCALLAARERATSGQSNRRGIEQTFTVYASSQAHSSVEKAVCIAGIGSDNLRAVAVDDNLAMNPDELEITMAADEKRGARPVMVVSTAGTTSTMAFDPLVGIADVCARHNVWLHVDAAMAGTAGLCPELRWIHDGLERADSYCFNPHKWMFTNFDCDAFYVADRNALISALSILPEYLRNPASESGAVIDYRDWQIPLGRRFRALKLWLVIRHYGVEGLRHHVRRHVELAREFASWVATDDRLEILQPQNLNLVCFRHRDGNTATEKLLERINSSGIYLTHTKINDVVWVRMSIGQTRTERRHVEGAWRVVEEALAG